jgi:primary-amine oxidase
MGAVTQLVSHPLDPLTADEIELASTLVRQLPDLSSRISFVSIVLSEPPKEVVAAFVSGNPIDRACVAIVRDRVARRTYRATASLSDARVVEGGWVEGQPGMTIDECAPLADLVRADSRYIAALARRGIHDMSLVHTMIFPAGYQGPEDDPATRRIVRMLTYARARLGDNPWARPIEGIHVVVDLDAQEVVSVDDDELLPVPERDGNFTVDRIADPSNLPCFPDGPRRDVRELAITQPDGPSFVVDGHHVRWQNWSFRLSFNTREGLVLHTIGYEDRGALRSIVHRASVSELWVPYGDTTADHGWNNALDVGEAGLGLEADSLELGCDCLGEIRYFDAVMSDSEGRPLVLRNAICMHEEDAGLAWKHNTLWGGPQTRRLRRLVVSSIATVGNYTYGVYWHLYQDGTIEFESKLTGIILPGVIRENGPPRHGVPVAPGVYGPHHQHFLSIRLDMAIDGARNSVYECDSVPLPLGNDNPYGNAWEVQERLMARESEAQCTVDAHRARFWKVVNPEVRGPLGAPVGYRLMPGDNAFPLLHDEAFAMRRGSFARKQLWVTRFDPTELFAAGEFPAQHPGGAGLPEYTRGDRELVAEDVVLWYTLGAHHVVRPEDWPVMPVTRVGFALKPDGFFDGNPCVDLPDPHSACHH